MDKQEEKQIQANRVISNIIIRKREREKKKTEE